MAESFEGSNVGEDCNSNFDSWRVLRGGPGESSSPGEGTEGVVPGEGRGLRASRPGVGGASTSPAMAAGGIRYPVSSATIDNGPMTATASDTTRAVNCARSLPVIRETLGRRMRHIGFFRTGKRVDQRRIVTGVHSREHGRDGGLRSPLQSTQCSTSRITDQRGSSVSAPRPRIQ